MSELMAPKSIRSLLKLNLVRNFKTSHSVLLWASVNCTDIAPPEQDHLEEMGVQETSLQCVTTSMTFYTNGVNSNKPFYDW